MGRTTATGTVFVPLYVAYRCSRCGNINYTKHIVSESREVSKYGTIHRTKTEDKMKETSLEYSKEAMGRRLTKIIEESKAHKYRSAEFNLRCFKCGNKEPWSKMRYTKIETILGVLIPFTILFALACLLSKAYFEFVYIVGGCGSILGLWYFIKHLLRNAMEKRILELSVESLPIISLSE